MKIITLTRGCMPRFHSHKIANALAQCGFDPWYVCDTEEQARLVSELVNHGTVVHTGQDREELGVRGACYARQWAMMNIVEQNEWCVWLDDNVRDVTVVKAPWYDEEKIAFDEHALDSSEWREIYRLPIEGEFLASLLAELRTRCIAEGTIFGGFAEIENYYFRPKHWSLFGYVKCKLAVYKNDGSRWGAFPGDMWEDFSKTVDVVARYGCVVVNKFARPNNPFYEEGGIGKLEDRLPVLAENCKRLMEMYPGLLRYVRDQDHVLQFAIRGRKSIDAWRKEHGYL